MGLPIANQGELYADVELVESEAIPKEPAAFEPPDIGESEPETAATAEPSPIPEPSPTPEPLATPEPVMAREPVASKETDRLDRSTPVVSN